MTPLHRRSRQLNTSLHLRKLLSSEEYSTHWKRFRRQREREPHQIAIAKVIAQHLQGRGDDVQAAHLKDKISRALRSREPRMTEATLELFIRAFAMSDGDAERLRALWHGIEPPSRITELPRQITGELRPPAHGPGSEEPPFRTIALREFHYIGADGRPARHRTVRDIRSLTDGLRRIRYSFDTNEASVDRISGGVPGEPYRHGDHIWSVDVVLPRTLDAGHDHSLEFDTSFRCTGEVPPNFRRVAHHRIEGLTIRVEFDPARLPSAVYWTQWRDYRPPDDVVLHRRPVPLDDEHAVYHRLDLVERAVVGFEWSFDTP